MVDLVLCKVLHILTIVLEKETLFTVDLGTIRVNLRFGCPEIGKNAYVF